MSKRSKATLPYEWGAPNDARALIAQAPTDIQEAVAWIYARELGKGPVRTLEDMSPEEIAELEAYYGCKVKSPDVTASPQIQEADAVSSVSTVASAIVTTASLSADAAATVSI